ncbi:hypothetical protein PTTG_29534 [Puccinia triticina 1-1 BBBD Race 1]|uniref:Secreted protein n=2 Tax=Puccinia triticina TaxID=208348 RepID=A0A180G3J8_PUCT1|nr:uncharacterized protein PtA15_1A543 [Puccinia triticina]OAV87180.1 hypothetical protein PTTG_29534 [Puccinia triticina 1-1 BBBD Race 1]WAQ81203.1 hypothetical protein PtA15_1A543 [Puccinia triticina]WAR52102.1 hypothetical protein PtB15_1B541 [Puccinia triticina]
MHFFKSIILIGSTAVFGLPSAPGNKDLNCAYVVQGDDKYPSGYCGTSWSSKDRKNVYWTFSKPEVTSDSPSEHCSDTDTRWCCKIDASLKVHPNDIHFIDDSEVNQKCKHPPS